MQGNIVIKNPQETLAADGVQPSLQFIGVSVEEPVKDAASIASKHVNTAQEIQNKEDAADTQNDSGPIASFFT
jgi:hypothetical protein